MAEVNRRMLIFPIDLSGFGIQGGDSPRVPYDQLANTGVVNDHGRGVARFPFGIQSSPDLFAGQFVEGDDLGVRPASHQADEFFAVDQRMTRHPPRGKVQIVIFDKIFLPDGFAGFDVEAEKVANRANHVDMVPIDRRGTPWSVSPNAAELAGVDGPLLGPQDLPGFLIQTDQPFNTVVPFFVPKVGHKDAAIGHGWSTVAELDRHAPRVVQSVLAEFVQNPRVVPDSQPLFATPTWPILSECSRLGQCDCANGNQGSDRNWRKVSAWHQTGLLERTTACGFGQSGATRIDYQDVQNDRKRFAFRKRDRGSGHRFPARSSSAGTWV